MTAHIKTIAAKKTIKTHFNIENPPPLEEAEPATVSAVSIMRGSFMGESLCSYLSLSRNICHACSKFGIPAIGRTKLHVNQPYET